MKRQEIIKHFTENPEISVLIIGAGINGIGTFRDLALQGVDVLIVEKNDFCSGASAASSHMVHGGVRYLENGEFRLVREAVQERNRLLQNAPHLVKPLPTTIPMFKWTSGLFNAPFKFLNLLDKPAERGGLVIKVGLMLYDSYTSGTSRVPKHQFTGRTKSLEKFPALNQDIVATATYYDGAMPSPERIAMEILGDGLAEGDHARALNYVAAVDGSPEGVVLQDEVTGETFTVKPKLIINAGGPWIDFVNKALGEATEFIGGTKGSHLVLDHPELHEALNGNELFFENNDGRIVLIYPVLDRVIVGTSDLKIDDPDEARCTDEEVDYFLELTKKIFPNIPVTPEHIVFRFSGVRPLPSSKASTTGQISRDHHNRIVEPSDNRLNTTIFNLIGGKWTTFRAFSEQVTDAALTSLGRERKANTRDLPVGGGANYPKNKAEQQRFLEQIVREAEVSPDQAKTLFERYGTRALEFAHFMSADRDQELTDRPDFTQRELLYLAQQEQVEHLEDLLLRRSVLGLMGYSTPKLIEEVAGALAPELGWDDERKAAEIARVRDVYRDRHQAVV